MYDDKYNFCENAPGDFSFCLNADCASAGECLRGLAARDLTEKMVVVSVINPLLVDSMGVSSCRFFRKAEKVRVAYGFKRALAKVESGKVRMVRSFMCGIVCQRDYYYLLRGDKPLYPHMQKKVVEILIRCGLEEPIEFDRYGWHYEWNKL